MKLDECSGPIDKNAARVVKKAAPEDLWLPKPTRLAHKAHSPNVLPTIPVPYAAKEKNKVIGMRRDRMTVVGYAASQPINYKRPTRWVVRCDCGNFEHRTKIFRWLGTQAPDMCDECRLRTYKTTGEWAPRTKAERATLTNTDTKP